MSWEPTNELRMRREKVMTYDPIDKAEFWLGHYKDTLQQKWIKAVVPEHDGATGYFEEMWRDVPVVDE